MHISSLFLYTYKLEEVLHSAHPSFFAGGLSFLPNFQKGGEGLTEPQLLYGSFWEKGGDFFQGALQFSQKK